VKNRLMCCLGLLGMGLGLAIPANLAFAEPEGSEHRDSFAELSAEWWQWAVSIPTPLDPLVTEGNNCMVGQHGDVWFLSGIFAGGPEPVARTCSVPEGVPLFFPLINNVNINTPDVCGQNSNDLSVRELRAQVAPVMDTATNLSVEVDGKPFEHFRRVRSKVFYVAIPEDNIFNAFCGGAGSVPPGIYSPAIDDGFYALLQGLRAGTHTLHFHAENMNSTQDVTFTLHVVRVARSVRHPSEH
jgi:hypothetical protein